MGLFQKPKKEKRGIKVLVYGSTGVGKSIFALSFPRNAIIDTEDGTAHYVDEPNMALRVVTTSATDVENAIEEVRYEYLNDIDSLTLDSETKMYENLQHSGLVVVENRARANGRSAFGEGLSQKEWGKIKLIHKRINSKLIELSGMGKNIIVIAQLAEEKQQIGDSFVKVGEKPNGLKGLEFDFDIVMKLCFDKETKRRYGVIEKDRTGTYEMNEEIDNPSFENWKHIFEQNSSLESAQLNLNKNIEADTREFEVDISEVINEIKVVMKDKLSKGEINNNQVIELLSKYGVKKPQEISEVKTADLILEELKGL